MTKFLISLLRFLAFSTAFYVIVIFLWEMIFSPPYEPNLIFAPRLGMLDKRLEDLSSTKNVDVLILGSSKAYRGFDPRIFKENGLTAFNLGSSSQTHIQTNFFLKKYLSDLDPTLVVYEITPDIFMLEGVESAINIVSATKGIDNHLIEMVMDINHLKVYNSLVLKLWRLAFFDNSNLKYELEKEIYIDGGFVESDYSFHEQEQLSDKIWTPKEEQLRYFHENLQMIRDAGTICVLVVTPYKFRYINDEEVQQFFNNQGIFLNYNKILEFDYQKDFYDEHHLNQKGVQKLNTHLVPIIRKIINNRELATF